MPLFSKPTCRKMWMFPRNIRRIEPWKISQIASLLQAASGDAGSQELQDELYAELGRLGIKREKSDDGAGVENPGGLRTYLAQLACLGLFYVDKAKRYVPTHAGELIIEGRDPVRVLRCQLLRLQYPSVYGWGNNVRMSPAMRVKPFAFLVRLLRDARLDGFVTCEEAAVCVIYGRTRSDFGKCIAKILRLRNGEAGSLSDVVDDLADICTPKRWNKQDDVLWDRGITDAQEIANTAMNYLIAVGFVVAERSEEFGGRIYRLTTDEKALSDIEQWLVEDDKIEAVRDDPNVWINAQNRFGRYDKDKVMSIGAKSRVYGFAALLKAAYIAEVERKPYGFDHAAFVRALADRWHKPQQEVEACVTDIRKRVFDISRASLINAANSGGADAIRLEIGMTNVFRILGFDLAEHIGQWRPSVDRPGGYPDIYLRVSHEEGSGMADTKATTKYAFPLTDTQKLKTYYKNAWKEIDPRSPSEFFLYIAGSFARSQEAIGRTLSECSRNYGAPVSAVTVYALLDLASNEKRPTASSLMRVFRKAQFFNSDAQIIECAQER